jgi:PHP family Zn ribbon phosphoesterase
MLREFRADLHIHTCLSPCGSLAMVPGVIVKETLNNRLDVIGICDHNATENVAAVRKAAEKEHISVLGGMEITSEEEVHVLALFDDNEKLLELQRMVYENLPGVNDERAFGEQVVIDENDQLVQVNNRLLIGATRLSLQTVVDVIHSLSGLAIASHVDRDSFGILGQLGFIPEGLRLDALEVSPGISVRDARANLAGTGRFPVVTFSDAHRPEDIGRRWTGFVVEDMRVEEMRKALLHREGRATFVAE